ncbi:hypothetical protein QUC31_020929 [Theobroma cacao]
MAPRKRKVTDGNEGEAKPLGQETLKRVTRSMTKQPGAESSQLAQPNKEKPKAKANASAKEKKVKVAVAVEEAAPEDLTVSEDGSHNKTVVVEHCKQCNSFKTRAVQVKDGLEKGVPGIKVLLNPEKWTPIKG